MDRRRELSAFLRSRRVRLTPANVGLPEYGGRRRVAGLRREEVAMLATISVDYYVRLEQGRVQHVSDGVLSAVSSALRLDRDERLHLRNLAGPSGRASGARGPSTPLTVRPGLRQMIESFTGGPAYVLTRHMQVACWNHLAKVIFHDVARLPAGERNLARYVFLDPAARATFADWPDAAHSTAAYLRLIGGEYPDDPDLAALVGELALNSEDFRKAWADHPVGGRSFGNKTFRHPLVGELPLAYETMPDSAGSGDLIFIFFPRPETDASSALQILASWAAPAMGPRSVEAAGSAASTPERAE